MNYPAAELRGIKMNFYLINPDAEHRGILLIKLTTNIDYNFVQRCPIITASINYHAINVHKKFSR